MRFVATFNYGAWAPFVNNADDNRIRQTQYGVRVTDDPRRLHGVTLYRETDRAFAKGDRVQVTAPACERAPGNRELGTIERGTASGQFRLQLDSGG